jgi:hypothetical protein
MSPWTVPLSVKIHQHLSHQPLPQLEFKSNFQYSFHIFWHRAPLCSPRFRTCGLPKLMESRDDRHAPWCQGYRGNFIQYFFMNLYFDYNWSHETRCGSFHLWVMFGLANQPGGFM